MKKYLSRLLALVLALILLVVPASALTVDQALELLEEIYYYEIPDEAYQAKTVEELIQILGDPYTDYMNPEEYQDFLASLEGETGLVGIGVTIQYTDEGILIVSTASGGSARQAGFQPGDLIVEIDGVSCVPATAASGDLISGQEGTTVEITILRNGETSTHTLTRRPVVIPNTDIQLLDGGIGYIDCSTFGLETGKDFAGMLEANDSKVNVWILDLRGNPGGYTNAAVEMINALMGPGRYVYVEYNDGTVEYVPGLNRASTAKPVIVLTDTSSASSSEIVASNIRDGSRGITVGGRTYGKGVAQSILDESVLPDYFEDGGCLKVTVYRFYSTQFNTTDKVGVIPALLVDDDKVTDVALALCGTADGAQLRLRLGASADYYIDPDTDGDTLSALFAALPPQAKVSCLDGGKFAKCTISQAADRLGVDYDSRWFIDVGDSKYADAINAMGAYELLQGDGKGSFSPKGQLTRAELCTMLARVLNVSYRGPSLFTDVSQDEWYGPSVNAMAYLELVNGVGGGKFDPGATLTQEEFFTIMGRIARFVNLQLDAYGDWVEGGGRLTLSQRTALNAYSDWARSSMAVLAWGMDEAMDDSAVDLLYAPMKELSPKTPILREEAAAGMYAVLSGLRILPGHP